jgi:hypothetical protein
MGILDDAIRQHLELKRQRGATESELKQLEDEAFGPPARPGEAELSEPAESQEQSGNGAAAGEPPQEGVEPTPESEELTAIYDETADREADLEALEPQPEAPVESLDTVEHALPEEAPAPGEPAARESIAEPEVEPDQAPEEPLKAADEGEPAADSEVEGADDDDVLADTPDFLRDSPEDDELWFEQREPKDFDF